MEKQFLAIRYNSVAGVVSCALCNNLVEAEVGLAVCLPDAPRQLICKECASRHDPDLAKPFGDLRFLEHNRERLDQMEAMVRRKLETVGILATMLRLSGKDDISYAGRVITDIVSGFQKELDGLTLCQDSYDPDEIPF